MHCHACGTAFRSAVAEARHRHNFPALCNKKSAAWKRFKTEQAVVAAPLIRPLRGHLLPQAGEG